MFRALKTVKARIIAIMLCFALVITTMVISFSYYLIYSYQRQTNINSTKFNINLVSQIIERDFIQVVALANWCGSSTVPSSPARFLAAAYSPAAAVESYNRLQEEVVNSQTSYNYINRIMVIGHAGGHLLHAGRQSSVSSLSFLQNEERLEPISGYELKDGVHIYDISNDKYSRIESETINILAPVYAPASRRVTGTVYMAVDTAIITDNLKGYSLPQGAELYFTIENKVYRIEGKNFVQTTELAEITDVNPEESEDGITVGKVKTKNGEVLDAVSCRVRGGIYITQVFNSAYSMPTAGSWYYLVFAICLLILLLAVVVIITMNRTISRPVVRIRRKLDEIAEGDFSADAGIESDSEIGEVGRGVNRLSHSVVELMEKRLADEQQKQDLEYRMLQSQINPHFLYNTLGAIKWMATLQKADGIAEMTTALSHLLKSVAKDLRKVVPLGDELALLDDYFLILKYRYGGAISFEKHIEDEELLNCVLPRFVLQPLMENAVFHGIEPKGRGEMHLFVEKSGDDVLISLKDDGVGMDSLALEEMNRDIKEKPHDGKEEAVGMRSVHQRVRSVFGEGYGLTAESEKGVYTKMTIRIPCGAPQAENGTQLEGENV